ncbi:hypothetical protein Tco_0055717, partial [Tanacetum coccineum]
MPVSLMRYGLLQMPRRRQSLLTTNIPKTNYSMLERSAGIARVTKATLGPEAITKEYKAGAASPLRRQGPAVASPLRRQGLA